MSTVKTIDLSNRLVGLASVVPHSSPMYIQSMLETQTAQKTTRKDQGDAALAWTASSAAENADVVGSIPVQDGDTTVTIHSGNTSSAFAISSLGVVTVNDHTVLVAGSPYTLVLRVAEVVNGFAINSETTVIVTVV